MPNNNPLDWVRKMAAPKRNHDIELPNDTGVRDKRLPPPTKFDDIKRNYQSLKGLLDATAPPTKKKR